MAEYLQAIDTFLQKYEVSKAGQKLARGLPDWHHYCRKNATHFFRDEIHIYFLNEELRNDFLRTLEISENDQCIPPGDARRIFAAFMELVKHQEGVAEQDPFSLLGHTLALARVLIRGSVSRT